MSADSVINIVDIASLKGELIRISIDSVCWYCKPMEDIVTIRVKKIEHSPCEFARHKRCYGDRLNIQIQGVVEGDSFREGYEHYIWLIEGVTRLFKKDGELPILSQ